MTVTETDITEILTANVDQMIADDFKPSGQFRGPTEFTIVSVAVRAKRAKQQSMSITVEEYSLPYRPCLTMQRLLADQWGVNATQWKGRTIRLYRDIKVNGPEGQKNVGGIRINGLSDIPESCSVLLTESRGHKREWPIEKLERKKPASAPWTAGVDHASWEADREAFAAELAKLDLDIATIDQRLADDAALRKWWNGSECAALRCSWVPSAWRANLVKMLAKKKAAEPKPEAARPTNAPESQQGD